MFSCPVSAGPPSGGRDPWAVIVPWLQAASPLASAPLLAMTGMALAANIATMNNATVTTKAMRLNASPFLPIVLVRPSRLYS